MDNPLRLVFNRWAERKQQELLLNTFGEIADALSCQMFTSAGLVIKAGGGVLAKAGTACRGIVKGNPILIAANTDMAALSGVVANGTFNVFVFDINSAGTLTTTMGTAGATYAAVKFPPKRKEQTRIGFVVINPTGTGNFTGNTTPLDDATVVPNAVYVNLMGAYDQTFIR